jgi:Rrf2 family protein
VSYISNAVEYGLHCLLHLVSAPGKSVDVSTRELAQLQGVSAEYLAKIFTKLHRAALVAGTEGTGGGFALARAPEDISVLDVVVAIDGKKALFDCKNVRLGCAVFGAPPPRWASSGVCSIHAVMLKAEASMRAELASHSIAELAARVEAKAPASYTVDVATWLGERSRRRRGV